MRSVNEELEDYRYDQLQPQPTTIDITNTDATLDLATHLNAQVKFRQTSVHDVSLRAAWSEVIQADMEMLPAVEALLGNFTEVSQ
jgi:Ras-related GTP-binding protein C/D